VVGRDPYVKGKYPSLRRGDIRSKCGDHQTTIGGGGVEVSKIQICNQEIHKGKNHAMLHMHSYNVNKLLPVLVMAD
jgi:hypothetical protein